jgi:serine/threonine protein kinase
MRLPLRVSDGFILEELLGEGVTSWVYRARLTKPRWGLAARSNVALKVFKQMPSKSERKRIEREVAAGASVSSKYLAKYYSTLLLSIGPIEFFAVAIELVLGVSLKVLMTGGNKRNRPLRESVIFTWLIQVATGLDALHQNGIVHRDIHPGNILVIDKRGKKNPSVCLVDFGLARKIKPNSGELVTEPWEEIGSRRYWAPELLTNDPYRWSPQSDLYMLGATFYHYLTGKLIYHESTSYYEFFRRLASNDPQDTTIDDQSWVELSKRYSREFFAILKSLLDKFPARRPFSAAMLKNLHPPLNSHIVDPGLSWKKRVYDPDSPSWVDRPNAEHLAERSYSVGQFYLDQSFKFMQVFHALFRAYNSRTRFKIQDICNCAKHAPDDPELVRMVVSLADWGILIKPEPLEIGVRKKGSYHSIIDGFQPYWYVQLDCEASFEFSKIATRIIEVFESCGLSLEKLYALLTSVFSRSEDLNQYRSKPDYKYHLNDPLGRQGGFYSSFDDAYEQVRRINPIYWVDYDNIYELRRGKKRLVRSLRVLGYHLVDGFTWTHILNGREDSFCRLWLLRRFELIPKAYDQMIETMPSLITFRVNSDT